MHPLCLSWSMVTLYSSWAHVCEPVSVTDLPHPVKGDWSILQTTGLFDKLQDGLAARHTPHLIVQCRTVLEQEVPPTTLYQLWVPK